MGNKRVKRSKDISCSAICLFWILSVRIVSFSSQTIGNQDIPFGMIIKTGRKPCDLQPICLKIVIEVTGLEPAASASRTQRSTKLSHTSV